MPMNTEVLAIILGGGQGARLFPLTQHRSKPAVPIGGSYRLDYCELVDAHVDSRADITIAAQPIAIDDASAMGIFRFDRNGQIVAFEEKPNHDRLAEIGQSIPPGATFGGHTPDKPFVASM